MKPETGFKLLSEVWVVEARTTSTSMWASRPQSAAAVTIQRWIRRGDARSGCATGGLPGALYDVVLVDLDTQARVGGDGDEAI